VLCDIETEVCGGGLVCCRIILHDEKHSVGRPILYSFLQHSYLTGLYIWLDD
jgi:hypothetical protein